MSSLIKKISDNIGMFTRDSEDVFSEPRLGEGNFNGERGSHAGRTKAEPCLPKILDMKTVGIKMPTLHDYFVPDTIFKA